LRDATALGTGALLSQAILLFAAPAFLRLYEPADFGLYSFAYGMIALAATVATWKIQRLIVVVSVRATAIRLLAALVSIAVVTAASFLVLAFLSAAGGLLSKVPPGGLALLWPAPLAMFVLVASAGFRNYSIRVRRFKAVAAAQISRAVMFAAGMVATGFYWRELGGHGALIMMSWQIAADACALLVQIGANRKVARLVIFRPQLRKSLATLMTYRKTLSALVLEEIISAVNQQLPISTVTLAFGAVHAGWYALASQFVSVPGSVVALAVGDVANQRLSRLNAARRPFSHLVLRATIGMAAIGIVPFASIALLGPKLLPLVLGPSWLGASQSVSLLAVASYLWFTVAPADRVALIVQARRYIVLWQMLKLAKLAGCGAVALVGWVPYSTWLVLIVAGDVLLYLLTAVSAYIFARNAESRWRQMPRPPLKSSYV
jgi:O-antigen/teichoic acid export membrane protein